MMHWGTCRREQRRPAHKQCFCQWAWLPHFKAAPWNLLEEQVILQPLPSLAEADLCKARA